jgi:glycerol uptake facilitator protein
MFAILGIGQTVAGDTGLNFVFVWAIITAIGMSFGGVTGYAMNAARDLSPRLAFALFCPGDNKDADWGYAWIPVVAPICGAIVAALVYGVMPFPA